MSIEHLTDRLPDVLHGRGTWSEAEQAHLDSCESCRAEWQLLRAVAESPTAFAPDATAVATGVLRQLREPVKVLPFARPERTLRRVAIGMVAAAALAAVFLMSPTRETAPTAVVPARAPTLLPELDGLLDADLEVVLAMLTEDVTAPLGDLPRVGHLTDSELELLLEEIEG